MADNNIWQVTLKCDIIIQPYLEDYTTGGNAADIRSGMDTETMARVKLSGIYL